MKSLRRGAWISLALLAVCVCPAPPAAAAERGAGTQAELQPGPGRLSLEYRPARTRSDRRGQRLWQDGFLERVVAGLNARLTLPVDVKILAGPGESGDAPSSRANPVLKVGYAFPLELRPLFNRYGSFTRSGKRVTPTTPRGRRLRARAIREVLHGVLLHEYADLFVMPTSARKSAQIGLIAA